MNNLTIYGRVTNDPRMTEKEIGGVINHICEFSVMVDNEMFKVRTMREIAETCAAELKKNDRVIVKGAVGLRSFVQDNIVYTNMVVRAEEVQFVDREHSTEKKEYIIQEDIDEMPF